jgi:hypothetical protein
MQTARLDFNKMSLVIPAEIRSQKAWVGYVTRENNGRVDKIPMNVMTGAPARSNDPATWSDYETAVDLAIQRNYAGIGFMFQPPYVGVDIDHCVKDGAIETYALEILKALNSYSEYSPSGTGIHTLCKGEIPRACKISKIGLEIYTKGRFFTVTGNRLENYPAELNECTDALKGIFSRFVDKAPVNDILSLIANSKDAERFQRLYSGQWQNDYPSQSEADLALCNKLAFWTGKDTARMDSLFRQSGLMRAKWDEKHFGDGRTYGQSVIEKAVQDTENVFAASVSPKQKKLTQGEIITRDCEETVSEYLRDQQGNPYVVLPFDKHLEVCQTSSSRFRNYCALRYRQDFGHPPGSEALKQAKVQIEAKCEGGRQVELYNRVGWHDGAIYYDLTTQDWRGVVITKDGWEVVFLPPIFKRYPHQAEQVFPVKGSDPKKLLEFCNINKDDACLFMMVVAAFFIPDIPHVIPVQIGEQGTGKSNNSRLIKSLCDPSKVMSISVPKDLEQAQMIADKHWVNNFDNLSRVSEWFSDFLCRAVTGEGDMKRSLYTNDEEFIRTYRRCFVLNGIGSSICRPDLLDRSVIFDIPILKETKPEKVIACEWRASLPGILGGFFSAISNAMAVIDSVSGHERFRMSDFAQWSAALSQYLGFSREEFFKRYQQSVDHKWEDTAEESTFAQRLVYLVESNGGEWAGSATTLLESIKPETGFDKSLPGNARALGSELMRIAPVMRSVGIDILRPEKREAGTGRKLVILRRVKGNSLFEGSVNENVNECEQGEGFCEEDDTRPY